MSKKAKLLSLLLVGVSIGGVMYYLAFDATLGAYIAWGAMTLAWTVMIFTMTPYLDKMRAVQATLVVPFWLAVGSFIASAFRDTFIAWCFLIAAVLSFPIILLGVDASVRLLSLERTKTYQNRKKGSGQLCF